MAELIDRAWLKAYGRWRCTIHCDMGHSSQTAYDLHDARTDERVGLTTTTVTWKRKRSNGDKAGTTDRYFCVDTHSDPIRDLDSALEILRIIRSAQEEAPHA